jgi:hypothetical protein
MRHEAIALFLPIFSLAFAAGCSKPESSTTSPMPTELPSGHPAISGHGPSMPAAPSGEVLEGKVLEKIDVTQYTYLRIESKSGNVWAAVPRAEVTVGAEVAVERAMPMTNFNSPTLNRKFDKIYFGVLRGGEPASPHGSAAPAAEAPLPIPSEIKVDKAKGENAFTVEEVFKRSEELSGKEVRIRGVVVKVNARIMDRNWIHLRDGTGADADKNNDIVVTSSAEPRVGATVTVVGKVATKKDFGGGYSYAVLVEGASLTPEGGK